MASTEVAPAPLPGAERRAGFRPDIEGLRAVAVLAVLTYHAGLPVSAGFVGVDIFFVISGFLITGLLLTELETTGRISWLHFLGRRIRRLLPAALAVLVATSVLTYLLVPPGEQRQAIGWDVIAASTYVVNWVLAAREVDYLASDLAPSPVQHFWSLAVEEQFYLLWPLLLIAVVVVLRRCGRRPGRRTLALVLGGVLTLSLGWSIHSSHASPQASFFTTTTRAWELGVGALLALWLTGRRPTHHGAAWTAPLGWASLGALGLIAVHLPRGIEWPSAWALLPTLPTAAIIWVGAQGVPAGPARLLQVRPLVWLGGFSYSIYLWHWPVLVLGDWGWEGLTGGPMPSGVRVAAAALSLWPAWVSWRYLERPLHRGQLLRGRPRALVAGGVALSAVGVLAALPLLPLGSPFVTTPAGGVRPPLDQLGAATVVPDRAVADAVQPGWVTPDPLAAGKDRPDADVDRCQVPEGATAPVACTFGEARAGVTIALVGDSKAMQWLPALQERAPEQGWRILTYGKSACAFAAAPATRGARAYPECDEWNDAVLAALEADPPDLVLTSGVARAAWDGSATDEALLVQGYVDRWSTLSRRGIPVVVVGDSPVTPPGLDVCAARNPDSLQRCTFPAGPAVAASGLPVQQAAVRAAGEGVTLLDLTPWICPGERCPVVIGHVAVHRPGDHVSATYARTLAPQLTDAVVRSLSTGSGPPTQP